MNKKRQTLRKIKARRKRPARSLRLTLRFSPTAWAKLLFLRDYGDTEIGGFGISHPDDLLLVEDIQLVRLTCSWAHVAFEDESVADFFDQQVDAGRPLETFGRIWIHTHPGDSPLPSSTDEKTFARVFGGAHWAVMFILAQGGHTYAQLRFNVGPGLEIEIPVAQDYTRLFHGCDPAGWEAEYLADVKPHEFVRPAAAKWMPFGGEPLDAMFDDLEPIF
jgi:hypothetical protein